jgi:hypothetical protein
VPVQQAAATLLLSPRENSVGQQALQAASPPLPSAHAHYIGCTPCGDVLSNSNSPSLQDVLLSKTCCFVFFFVVFVLCCPTVQVLVQDSKRPLLFCFVELNNLNTLKFGSSVNTMYSYIACLCNKSDLLCLVFFVLPCHLSTMCFICVECNYTRGYPIPARYPMDTGTGTKSYPRV